MGTWFEGGYRAEWVAERKAAFSDESGTTPVIPMDAEMMLERARTQMIMRNWLAAAQAIDRFLALRPSSSKPDEVLEEKNLLKIAERSLLAGGHIDAAAKVCSEDPQCPTT